MDINVSAVEYFTSHPWKLWGTFWAACAEKKKYRVKKIKEASKGVSTEMSRDILFTFLYLTFDIRRVCFVWFSAIVPFHVQKVWCQKTVVWDPIKAFVLLVYEDTVSVHSLLGGMFVKSWQPCELLSKQGAVFSCHFSCFNPDSVLLLHTCTAHLTLEGQLYCVRSYASMWIKNVV